MNAPKDQQQATVLRQIAALDGLSPEQLREQWRTLYGKEPPQYAQDLMKKKLAVRLQELFFGGLSAKTRARMDKILEEEGFDEFGARPAKPVARRSRDLPVPGTRLMREWNGERYEVLVTRKGFEWNGREYKSLSGVAQAITGTHWNGLFFFGLRGTAKRKD